MRKIIFMILPGIVLASFGVVAIPSNAKSTEAVSGQQLHSVEITGDVNGKVVKKIDGRVVPAAPTKALYSIYTNLEFRGPYICQDNRIGTKYPLEAAGDYFEMGASHAVLVLQGVETNSCAQNYADSQIIHFSVFNAQQNSPHLCWKVTGSIDTVSQPNYWRGNVQAQINNAVLDCMDDAQKRANTTSELIGNTIGLTAYNDLDQQCVMNLVMHFTIWWAQPCDTNRLGWIY